MLRTSHWLFLLMVAQPLRAADPITIFAAASTTDTVQALAKAYETERTST